MKSSAGMLWVLWAGMFELGSNSDTGGNSQLPYLSEHKLRIEHPEWIPINRFGTRRQDEGFAFCYPKARATLHATDRTAARRDRIICKLLTHSADIKEVVVYEAADWLYKLSLDDADLCDHSFLDRCPSAEQ